METVTGLFEHVGTILLTISGVVYGLVEVVKPIYDPAKRENLGDRVAAAGFAIFLCVASGFDMFPVIGLPLSLPYAGSVLTGMLFTGGGKALHDLIDLAGRDRSITPAVRRP